MIKGGEASMNNRIVRTKDGRVYHCEDCPYRNRLSEYCGFCMRKILDETKDEKVKKEDSGDV
jgi:Zn-finger protein